MLLICQNIVLVSQCQVNLLHIFEINLKYLSNTTFRHPFDSLVTGMSWPDDPVIVIQNVNFSTQKGNEKQPEQEALHDELKLRNPGVHISNLVLEIKDQYVGLDVWEPVNVLQPNYEISICYLEGLRTSGHK